jgi:predicted dehydrogenase
MKYRLGLIGLKGHQYVVLNKIPHMDNVELVALAEDNIDQEKMSKMTGFTENTGYYTDYKEMLEKEDINIGVVCNINFEHADVLKSLAERKINIVSEKPLVTTLKDLDKIKKLIEKNKVKLCMLMTMRDTPAFRAAAQAVAEGHIGEVAHVSGQKSYRWGNRAEYTKIRDKWGGIIPFIGIHAIDFMRWISKREFVEVMAYHSNLKFSDRGEMEDSACAIFRLDNGGTASMRIDYLRPAAAPSHGDDRIRVIGDKGQIEIIGEGAKAVLITSEKGPRELPLLPKTNLFENFIDVLEGKEDPIITTEEAFSLTKIALIAQESADTGKIMKY